MASHPTSTTLTGQQQNGRDNSNLKGLLRRVIGKIFNDLEIKGWCREYEVKNGVREEDAPSTETAWIWRSPSSSGR